MTKTKKVTQYHFGIQITKPHSKEMYTHNEKIAEEMKGNILKSWKELISDLKTNYTFNEDVMEQEWEEISDDSKLVKLQRGICWSGYGSGYTIQDVNDEFINELENMANWQLHETYSDACHQGLVPKIKQGMVGHKVPFYVYYTDSLVDTRSKIDRIKQIAGDKLSWISCTNGDGRQWKEPSIKCSNEQEAESLAFALNCNDVDAYVDCYEDDDGEGDGGRPIILYWWSVKFKNYHRELELEVPCSKELDNKMANESI